MGNPNVGKSVLFMRLTGIRVISSNYPGTTVSFTRGFVKVGDEMAEVIDVPGAYTLEPTSKAEEVAAKMLEEGDVVINVVDATNLERNLYLTLQLLERKTPLIVALNFWDDTVHRGIHIDVERLKSILGVPIIPTSALTGQGIKELVESIPSAASHASPARSRDERWSCIGHITEQVQRITHRHHRWFEHLEDASVKPVSGWLIAIGVLFVAFIVVRFIGEGLISYVLEPLFNGLWMPVLIKLSQAMGAGAGGLLHDIIIGQLIDGKISFLKSFGLLSSGLYVPFVMVLPYIFSFYLVVGLLEDTGYLPRLAVLLDKAMHRLGLHGYAIIPTLLGFGCNVPAIMATRILESKRERFIAATIVSIAVPCASLQAMIIGLVGKYGGVYVAAVYGALFIVWLILGMLLNAILKGASPELLIEIPPYRRPPWALMLQKLWLRIREFLQEAVPLVWIAVLAVNVLYFLGVFNALANFTAPVVAKMFGLPKEAVVAIIIGFLRKDVALGMLAASVITAKQMVIGAVVLSMFFPCLASFVVLFRELGGRNLLAATAVMLFSALLAGGLLNIML